MPSIHSKYSPSSSSRWLECPASVSLTDQDRAVLAQRDTSAADRGTLGHTIAEAILREDLNQADSLAADADEELLEAVDFCVQWVQTELLFSSLKLEERIESGLIPGFGGTMDVLATGGDILDVADFKFGQRKVVAESNTQLLCYLLLAREKYPHYKKYRGTIIQPFHESVERYEVTGEELDSFFVKVIEATLSDEFNPGVHCQYCPLLYRCEAAAREVWEAVGEAPSLEEALEPDPEAETISRAVRAFKAYRLAKAAVDELTKVIKDWIDKGLLAPSDHGLRLTHSARRKWTEDGGKVLEEALGEQAYEKTLASPAKVQKLLGLSKEDLAAQFAEVLDVVQIPVLRVTKEDYSDFEDLTR